MTNNEKYNSIMARMNEHYNEALNYFNEHNIVGLFLQGSQNYTLDLPGSDLDTKLIVTPPLNDIALARQPISTTHVRANEEHIDWKDIRLYIQTFRKQNLNFLEILFTPYFMINPMYADEWARLVAHREAIAHMNPWRAVKSMKGIALEKYHAMEHAYPSKVDVLAKYHYDPKQLHHLVRVDNYLTRYIAGESYEDCLIPEAKMRDFLLEIKSGKYKLADARSLAQISLTHVNEIADKFCSETCDEEDAEMRELLEDVCCNIIKISIKEELGNNDMST